LSASSPRPPATPRPRRSLVIGVLGGIASGKSAVARLLAGGAGVVVDADRIAREVLEAPETARWLERELGPGVLDPSGRPDRAALAERVFASRADRERLEGFTHPRIRARIRAALEDARAAGRPRIVLDVPLLLENEAGHGLVDLCDELVFVEAGEPERERRAREGRGWKPGELARREAVQMPLAAKRARAGHVIRNEGTLAELEHNVNTLLEALGAR
jgi:dephospho-CoA kinase